MLLNLKKNCISINFNFSRFEIKPQKLKLSEKFEPSHKIYEERCKLSHAVGLVGTKSPSPVVPNLFCSWPFIFLKVIGGQKIKFVYIFSPLLRYNS